jgi:glycosyltransferase involved in cell wall biosynthesis
MDVRAVAVVVPARDEEVLLPACLAALRRAVAVLESHRGLSADVVVVLDGCSDGSADVVAARPWVRGLVMDHAGVGAARRAGAESVLGRVTDTDLDRVLIATTDADSQVPPGWLVGLVDLVEAGAELVVGTVAVDEQTGPGSAVLERWRATYALADPHPHVHGANLALTGHAYRTVGGFPAVALGEDVALVEAGSGLRVVRSRALPVRTSGRLRSRVVDGFADHLRRLAGVPDESTDEAV